MDNLLLPRSVIDEVTADALNTCAELMVDVAKAMPPEEVRKAFVAAALREVKFSGGSKRRAAFRELDKVVRQYFPPVEGAPRPSTELAHVVDVFPGFVLRVPSEIYEIYPQYIPEYYENPQYRH
ncbi:hypothetical protein [uncultured Muribaculum sp.]|jgi:hypothetical protein|uniref:hypothetical protein n=1 Tax=uncultured Muribaculum sp. TaxID=1918613 RepID=UPI00272F66BE|nr:hypothetical protein [uncultured Muribaculum sp.]